MRRLNKQMLSVIQATQRLRSFVISDNHVREQAGLPERDWVKECEAYYSAIPDAVMKSARLHKNLSDLEDVLAFKVTPEMTATDYGDLGKFDFTRDSRQEYVDPPYASLCDRRHAAADGEFERYDFEGPVGEADGWEYTSPGVEYSRTVWLTNEADPDGDDIKASFTVVFASADSDEVVEAYATANGNEFGSRPQEPTPGPR